MKKIFTFSLIIIIFCIAKGYCNIGGAVPKPALVGRLVSFESPKISIKKEKLKIKAYEKNNETYSALFTAEYMITSTSTERQTVKGVFYGIRASDIQIQIGNSSIKQQHDSLTLSSLDSLFKAKVALNRFYPQTWFKWDGITRTGYSFEIDAGDSIILTVTGNLTAAYTSFWGLAEIGSMVWYKHPWANAETKPKQIQFEYLLEPISSWDSVGAIEVTFTYPKGWNVKSNIANIDKGFYKQDIKQTADEDSGYVTFQRTLKDSFPERLEFSYTEKPKRVFPGGPEFGFGGSKTEGFILHYRWEASIDPIPWVAIMPGIGMESNFKDTYRIVPMVKVNTLFLYLLGIRTGYVYDIKREKAAIRTGLSLDIMILGVSWDWDYYPDDNKWKKTILGTISF